MDSRNEAESLAYRVDQALKERKKELDHETKNRIKKDLNYVKRLVHGTKPERITADQGREIAAAKAALEQSAASIL